MAKFWKIFGITLLLAVLSALIVGFILNFQETKDKFNNGDKAQIKNQTEDAELISKEDLITSFETIQSNLQQMQTSLNNSNNESTRALSASITNANANISQALEYLTNLSSDSDESFASINSAVLGINSTLTSMSDYVSEQLESNGSQLLAITNQLDTLMSLTQSLIEQNTEPTFIKVPAGATYINYITKVGDYEYLFSANNKTYLYNTETEESSVIVDSNPTAFIDLNDGNYLITASNGLYNFNNGEATKISNESLSSNYAMLNNGNMLICGSSGISAGIYEYNTVSKELTKLEIASGVYQLTKLSDGDVLLYGNKSTKSAMLYNSTNSELTTIYSQNLNLGLTIIDNNYFLYSTVYNEPAGLLQFDTTTKTITSISETTGYNFTKAEKIANNKYILLGSTSNSKGDVLIYDNGTITEATDSTYGYKNMKVLNNGDVLLTNSSGYISLFDASTSTIINKGSVYNVSNLDVIEADSDTVLVYGTNNNGIYIYAYDVENKTLTKLGDIYRSSELTVEKTDENILFSIDELVYAYDIENNTFGLAYYKA